MKKYHLVALVFIFAAVVAYAAEPMSIQQFLQGTPEETAPQSATGLLTVRGGAVRRLPYTSVTVPFGAVTGSPSSNSLLGSLLDSKVGTNDSRLTDARTPLAHTQAISTVTGLQTALDAKADASHNQAISTVTGLQTVLDAKLPTANPTATGTMTADEYVTTGADGTRYIAPYNTTICPADGPMGAICTLPDGIYWYGTKDTITGWHLAGDGAYAAPMGIADLTDWPATVTSEEVEYLDGVTSSIQDQLNAIVAGSSGFVPPPAYGDSPCSVGQWSLDAINYYLCRATNNWGYKALSAFVDALTTMTPDTQPDIFTFTDQPSVALNTFVYSDTVQINGLNSPAAISVTGGSYKIDSGSWVTTPGTISNGQWVSAGHTSAGTGGTTTNTEVTIGGLKDTFSSTTVITAGADYIWPLLDNAATNSVNASAGGVPGYIDLGTTTTASVQTGTGFALPNPRYVKVAVVPNSGAWTIQASIRYLGQTFSNAPLINVSGSPAAFQLYIYSATQMRLYMNGADKGIFTVPALNANQTDNTVVRLIYDGTGPSLKVYTGTTEGTLALRHTVNEAITGTWGSTTKLNGWGAGNEISNFKIWNSAVLP